MKIQDILNTDIKVLGQWLKQGLDWWQEELRGMIPERLRWHSQDKASLVAVPQSGGQFRFYRN